MKKWLFIALLLIPFGVCAQTYDKKVKIADYGEFDREVSTYDKINISSYVTKQNILTYVDFEQKQKTVSELPKYRYELVLVSKSLYQGKLVKTWIYNARVFIDSVEVTRQQFPNGFTAIIETEPTVIYWYESSLNRINIEISWENSIYFRDNN